MGEPTCEALIVGGGFFGCAIAEHLKSRLGRVVLVEKEPELFRRASYANQARIHNGYHYPRSLNTAYRSHVNFEQFVRDFRECVVDEFDKIYCIARQRSRVSARQFQRFCNVIGAPWKPARPEYARLFDARLIEAVFEVREFAFDSHILRDLMARRLERAGVEVRLGEAVERVEVVGSTCRVHLSGGVSLDAARVFNCTYAGLRRIPGLAEHCNARLKQQVTEMALIDLPQELRGLGITVMDGPFFSIMPFPPRGLHTLSHVRYTPHCSWIDEAGAPDPDQVLGLHSGSSKGRQMLLDAQRYLPALRSARLVDSLFEIKTLLVRNEVDDGRPILLERSRPPATIYAIMGGKLDNIYDVFSRLRTEDL